MFHQQLLNNKIFVTRLFDQKAEIRSIIENYTNVIELIVNFRRNQYQLILLKLVFDTDQKVQKAINWKMDTILRNEQTCRDIDDWLTK